MNRAELWQWAQDPARTVEELAQAIRVVEQETAAFERDVLTVRARLRRSVKRKDDDLTLPRGEAALSDALRWVEEERDAHARAVAFARNYIDVEAEQWAQEQRALRNRLEHVADENRGLRRTVEVALGQTVLRRTLECAAVMRSDSNESAVPQKDE